MSVRTWLTVAVVLAVCGSLIPATAIAGQSATETAGDGWQTSSGDAQRTNANDAVGPTGPNATITQRYRAGGPEAELGLPSVPAVVDGTAYVGYDDSGGDATYLSKGRVIAYDTESGAVEWNRSDLPAMETPTVADGRVYVTGDNPAILLDDYPENRTGGVFALDADTGETVWERDDAGLAEPGSSAVSGDRMYVETGSNVAALNATTGETVWTRPLEAEPDQMSVGNGTVVLRQTPADYDGYDENRTQLSALNASTGDQKWRTVVTGNDTFTERRLAPQSSEVSLADGNAYVRVGDRSLYAVSLADGSVEWERTVSDDSTDRQTQWLSSPAVTDGTVYVSTLQGTDEGYDYNSTVFALNSTTGATEWQTHSYANLFKPRASDDTVFLPAEAMTVEGRENDGLPREGVFALNASSGAVRWTHTDGTVANPDRVAVAPAEGAVYVRQTSWSAYNDDGSVWALESTDEPQPDRSRFAHEPAQPTEPFVFIETEPDNAEDRDLEAGTNVTLTANASDPNGNVTAIEWDVDRDGEYERTGESVTQQLDYCGTLRVSVRVTDEDGETDVASVELSTT